VAEIALVCGANGALGQSLVTAFLERGDLVVAVERQPAGKLQPGVASETVDLTAPDEVEALWERLKERGDRPRWVVNAVGGFKGGTVVETEPDEFRFLVDLNLATTLWSCRAAARRLEPGSAIVNVASRTALVGGAGAAVYSVTKAAVVRLTEVLAEELAERRIRVNAILPSVIDTPANRAAMPAAALSEAVPPAQIAAVASFLSSDAAAAVSGAVVPVYGWA
jgi:NAD(P)-dependent dehydrogenase (short-subunit alcohol dehydrogenase family)